MICAFFGFNKHLLILASTVTEQVSISAFTSLIGIHLVIASSKSGLNICAITAGIKKYTSMITIIKKEKIR